DRSMDALLGPTLVPQILDSGYNFDFIDDAAIEKLGITHGILILPNVERIPLAAYRKIEAHAQKGGIVVATRRVPGLAPGLREAERDTPAIKQISAKLFDTSHVIENEETLGQHLKGWLPPDFQAADSPSVFGVVHRKLDDGELYFVANTSNQAIRTKAKF